MSIESLVNEFRQIAENPKAQLTNYKAEGKKQSASCLTMFRRSWSMRPVWFPSVSGALMIKRSARQRSTVHPFTVRLRSLR